MSASYEREWTLFRSYCAATDQAALPSTAAAVAGFLTAVPARPATVDRRLRAIAAAHRHAGWPTEDLRLDLPSATSAHTHLPGHQRWRQRRWLVTGVDQHGRLGEDTPLSARAITTCLAAARTRAGEAAGGAVTGEDSAGRHGTRARPDPYP